MEKLGNIHMETIIVYLLIVFMSAMYSALLPSIGYTAKDTACLAVGGLLGLTLLSLKKKDE